MISRVNVKVNQQAYNLVCLGENQKRNPKSIPEAQFSMAYVLGTILQQKSLSLKDFTDHKIKSKKRLKYCSLIHSSVSDEIDKNTGKQISPALVEVFLKDGSRHEKYVDRRKGHPDNPLSMEELKEKFKNCLSFREKMIKESVQDAIFNKIMNLEKYNPIRIATLLKN
jgi:2-methylcitrate dehydratase PrpD